MAAATLAPGWQPKKRLLLQTAVSKKRPPRAPSHANTQMRDPTFKKLRVICVRLRDGIDGSDKDDAQVATFVAQMESFLGFLGLELLSKMEVAKKLAELVIQELKLTKRAMDTSFCNTDADHLFSMFPKRADERDYSVYRLKVQDVARFVEQEESRRREAERASMAEKGGVVVDWKEDF